MPDNMERAGGRTIKVPADKIGLDRGRDFVVGSLNELGVDPETTFALTTSFLEFFENIMKHGYAGKAGVVTVEVNADDKSAMITLTDSGCEFNILEYGESGDYNREDLIKKGIFGRMGIKTIKILCDRIFYSRERGLNKNVLLKDRE